MKNIFVAFTILVVITKPAIADDLYIAVDVGQSSSKDVCSGVPSGLSCSNSATAYRVGGGYGFTQNWGIEGNVGFLGEYVTERIGGGVLMIDSYSPIVLQLAGTGDYPLSNTFSLIGRLGIAYSSMTTTTAGTTEITSRTKMYYGFGGKFSLSRTLSFRVQYEDMSEVAGIRSAGVAKVSLISAGIVSQF